MSKFQLIFQAIRKHFKKNTRFYKNIIELIDFIKEEILPFIKLIINKIKIFYRRVFPYKIEHKKTRKNIQINSFYRDTKNKLLDIFDFVIKNPLDCRYRGNVQARLCKEIKKLFIKIIYLVPGLKTIWAILQAVKKYKNLFVWYIKKYLKRREMKFTKGIVVLILVVLILIIFLTISLMKT